MAKEPKIVVLRTNISETLRNDFKSVCAKEGRTMNEVVVELLEDYVETRDPSKRKDKQ